MSILRCCCPIHLAIHFPGKRAATIGIRNDYIHHLLPTLELCGFYWLFPLSKNKSNVINSQESAHVTNVYNPCKPAFTYSSEKSTYILDHLYIFHGLIHLLILFLCCKVKCLFPVCSLFVHRSPTHREMHSADSNIIIV